MSDTQPLQTSPIDDFSQCHAGIISKLDLLGQLPALLAPAQQARDIAETSLEFFREAIFEHHLDEERELFPAVMTAAEKGREFDEVHMMTARLTAEHRSLEKTWKRLEVELKNFVKGRPSNIDGGDVQSLVKQYLAHAKFEEAEFLPLAQKILGRNSNTLAALGMSLHMRHAPLRVPGHI